MASYISDWLALPEAVVRLPRTSTGGPCPLAATIRLLWPAVVMPAVGGNSGPRMLGRRGTGLAPCGHSRI